MSAKNFKVAVICGSNRTPRAGDQITTFIESILKQNLPTTSNITLSIIDIAALNLPFFDEPGIPSKIHNPAEYAHEHTRSWSATVSSFDGFVFVSPQYNWGIPAGLKNAIDFLFNEWKGKVAMTITYGGHGGDKCDTALRVVLGGGIDMRLVEKRVNLAFEGRDMLVAAARGKQLGLDGEKEDGKWSSQRDGILEAWREMVKLLEEGETKN